MRAFRRVGDHLEAELEEFEVALLASLVEQLQDILGGPDSGQPPAGMDAFERLAAVSATQVELDHDDPLIERLFPAAYTDERDRDFRRFTEDDARRTRLDEASVVLSDLAATADGAEPLRLADDDFEAWVKTINALRLSLSVRLGITDADSLDALQGLSARDPRTHMLDIYDWLGFVLESLLDAAAS